MLESVQASSAAVTAIETLGVSESLLLLLLAYLQQAPLHISGLFVGACCSLWSLSSTQMGRTCNFSDLNKYTCGYLANPPVISQVVSHGRHPSALFDATESPKHISQPWLWNFANSIESSPTAFYVVIRGLFGPKEYVRACTVD